MPFSGRMALVGVDHMAPGLGLGHEIAGGWGRQPMGPTDREAGENNRNQKHPIIYESKRKENIKKGLKYKKPVWDVIVDEYKIETN